MAFLLGTKGNAFLLTSPILGTVAGGAVQNNKPSQKTARNSKVLSSPAYVEGYRKAARSKKLINSISASAIGGLVGALSGLVYANNSPE